MRSITIVVPVLIAAVLGTAPRTARATDKFAGAPLAVHEARDWPRTELHEDRSPLFVKEPCTETSRRTNPEIRAAFGGDEEPPSSRFLLHMAPGGDRKDDPRPPVLLVHGAVLDATRSFGSGAFKGRGGPGLAATLATQGRRVFAITFAHPHGCCFLQAEQLANAIARVKTVTGATAVDVVAHSKGGLVARLYCTPGVRKPGMTRYRGDVRKLILVGTPNAGADIAFAYPGLGWWIIGNRASGPLPWTGTLVYGVWTDVRKDSLYAPPEGGGAFTGQAQMLRRWDGVYGLYEGEEQLDVETTYRGGRGLASASLGIDRAIADGGDLVAKLEANGADSRIELSLLAGSKPALLGFVGERRGPSDGILLVRSALAQDGLARAGAKVARRDVLRLSHIELVYAAQAVAWIAKALGEGR